MARIRRLLPAAVATVLLVSLFFVNGSIAQPLGEGLMQRFGLGSSGASGGTEDATFQFGLPVTVMNDESRPVPVTLPGTLAIQDAEPAGAEPYEMNVFVTFPQDSSTIGELSPEIPAGKRLIIRYVSGGVRLPSNGILTQVRLSTTLGNRGFTHYIPFTNVATSGVGVAFYTIATETWIEADPETKFLVALDRSIGGPTAPGEVTVSGYLIDAPETATP